MPQEDPQQTLLSLTEAIGPATAYLARRLIESATRDACQRCLSLLCYARWFNPLRVERAALRLMDHGPEDLEALRFLLEQDLDTLVGRVDAELDGQLLLALPGVGRSHRT
jgi:hypothetical protein